MIKKIVEYFYFKFKKIYLEKYQPDTTFGGRFNEICEKYGHTIKFEYGVHESVQIGYCPRCKKALCTMRTKDSYTDPEFTDHEHPLEKLNKIRTEINK